jgi:hypothetical protein
VDVGVHLVASEVEQGSDEVELPLDVADDVIALVGAVLDATSAGGVDVDVVSGDDVGAGVVVIEGVTGDVGSVGCVNETDGAGATGTAGAGGAGVRVICGRGTTPRAGASATGSPDADGGSCTGSTGGTSSSRVTSMVGAPADCGWSRPRIGSNIGSAPTVTAANNPNTTPAGAVRM